jgi:CRISPR-associated protein Cas2
MYDISDDSRLRNARKILTGWGDPLQYSIYYARLTEKELEKVRYELTDVIEEDEDRLAVVRLCNSCADRVKVKGEDDFDLPEEPPPFRLV